MQFVVWDTLHHAGMIRIIATNDTSVRAIKN